MIRSPKMRNALPPGGAGANERHRLSQSVKLTSLSHLRGKRAGHLFARACIDKQFAAQYSED